MPRGSNRGRNNNPTGRNQYSDRGVIELVRERPFAATAAAAGAAAAGLFLWSKRAQISEQLNNLTNQIGEWTDNFRSGSEEGEEFETSAPASRANRSGAGSATASGTRRSNTRRSGGMSETGGGNASLGAHSGGGGTVGSASGSGRVEEAPTT